MRRLARSREVAVSTARDRRREAPMNIPVLVLLGFAAWTLIILSVGVGGYRWALILSGRASVAGWRADAPELTVVACRSLAIRSSTTTILL
jgi:hypothetical protein